MSGMQKGKFIVIEGTDGSGKTEQFNRLLLRLPQGMKFSVLDFPRYEEGSSYFVKKYLNGVYGTLEEVGPKQASLFYALDRFDASFELRKWLEEGKCVVANRYVGSNMGHQGAKITDEKERKKLFEWLYELEYGTLGIPRPDLNIILHVPAEITQALVDKKGSREYVGGAKRDLHEANLDHLKKAEHAYLEMAELYPKEFVLIECAPNGKLLSIEEIHEKVWAVAKRVIGA